MLISDEKHLIEIKEAHDFYIASPDGQHDLFVAEEMRMLYFSLTGLDLTELWEKGK